ncbi:MAG: hypothetical protein K6A96_00080 [Prevotella sp.]|nr:hypothetical protein [Prevotella sp.]
MRQLKEKYKRFREWQRTPHQVAPLSETFHDCATCGTHYQGIYFILFVILVFTVGILFFGLAE